MVFGGKSSSRTKLFEQRLDKLFSPKAIKQFNSNSSSNNNSNSNSNSRSPLRISSSVPIGADGSSSAKCSTKNINNSNNNLPEPIKRLLTELYLRGPTTEGIFRKSPNQKHCKELRQRLESEEHSSSFEQYQVNVIASVFKVWLRSLPDCLLMSRLYPQWIDVAKLIEPLHQHQQQLQALMAAELDGATATTTTTTATKLSDSTIANYSDVTRANIITSLRPSARSPLTDNGQLGVDNAAATCLSGQGASPTGQQLARARSCSIMISDDTSSSSPSSSLTITCGHTSGEGATGANRQRPTIDPPLIDSQLAFNKDNQATIQIMSNYALRERHSECVRIVRQLLEALNEPNLILLRAIISVLCHISNNSEQNKMDSINLGVCIGQSLLNDEHISTSGGGPTSTLHRFSASTFAKRHRRSRSQGLLLSTLSLTNLSPSAGQQAHQQQVSMALDSNSAQETAKYVPMLVAFMIDNAQALFGADILSLFENKSSPPKIPADGADEGTRRQHRANNDPLEQQKQRQRPMSTDLNEMHKENRPSGIDQLDSATSSAGANEEDLDNDEDRPTRFKRQNVIGRMSREQLVGGHELLLLKSSQGPGRHLGHRRHLSTSVLVHVGREPSKSEPERLQSLVGADLRQDGLRKDDSNDEQRLLLPEASTTSILIVNAPKKQQQQLGERDKEPSSGRSSSEGGQQRPLSATESTTSSSRASSSTSGVHSESPALSSEPDSHHNDHGSAASSRTATTCSSASSASISSSAPSSSAPSGCTSPVDIEVDGCVGRQQPGPNEEVTCRQRCRRLSEDPAGEDEAIGKGAKAACCEGQSVLDATKLQLEGGGLLMNHRNARPKSMVSLDEFQAFRVQQQQQQQQQEHGYRQQAGQLLPTVHRQQNFAAYCTSNQSLNGFDGHHNNGGRPVQSQTLNRYSTNSQDLGPNLLPNNRMPKIPFQYTTSCYGGEAVLYYPSLSHPSSRRAQQQQQQQQQQQHRHHYSQHQYQTLGAECHRSRSLNNQNLNHRHSLFEPRQQQQQPQRSHVMLLRDYYLSLQQQNQKQQQQLSSYRLQRQQSQPQQRPTSLSSHQLANHGASQQPLMAQQGSMPIGFEPHQSSGQSMRQYSSPLGSPHQATVDSRQQQQQQQQQQPAAIAYQRAQPRLAKIRSNQFNGLYVKRADSPQAAPTSLSAATGTGAGAGSRPTSGLIVLDAAMRVCGGGSGKSGLSGSQSSSQQSSKVFSSSSERSASSSADDSADEYTGEWMESTMV